MVTVCALYAHVIAFAAAFAKVGTHDMTHVKISNNKPFLFICIIPPTNEEQCVKETRERCFFCLWAFLFAILSGAEGDFR
jgi:hypothetical protein